MQDQYLWERSYGVPGCRFHNPCHPSEPLASAHRSSANLDNKHAQLLFPCTPQNIRPELHLPLDFYSRHRRMKKRAIEKKSENGSILRPSTWARPRPVNMSVKFEKETIRNTPIPGQKKVGFAHEVGERLTGGESLTGYLAVRAMLPLRR